MGGSQTQAQVTQLGQPVSKIKGRRRRLVIRTNDRQAWDDRQALGRHRARRAGSSGLTSGLGSGRPVAGPAGRQRAVSGWPPSPGWGCRVGPKGFLRTGARGGPWAPPDVASAFQRVFPDAATGGDSGLGKLEKQSLKNTHNTHTKSNVSNAMCSLQD